MRNKRTILLNAYQVLVYIFALIVILIGFFGPLFFVFEQVRLEEDNYTDFQYLSFVIGWISWTIASFLIAYIYDNDNIEGFYQEYHRELNPVKLSIILIFCTSAQLGAGLFLFFLRFVSPVACGMFGLLYLVIAIIFRYLQHNHDD